MAIPYPFSITKRKNRLDAERYRETADIKHSGTYTPVDKKTERKANFCSVFFAVQHIRGIAYPTQRPFGAAFASYRFIRAEG